MALTDALRDMCAAAFASRMVAIRSWLPLVSGSLWACLLVFGAPASASARSSSAQAVVIRFNQVHPSTVLSELRDGSGLRAGDELLLQFQLANATAQFGFPTGETVGDEYVALSFASMSMARLDGIVALAQGTISFGGLYEVIGPARIHARTLAVDGGTGVFANAHGSVTFARGASPLMVFRLSLGY